MSRWRRRPRVVLEVVCHLHQDVVLIQRGVDLRSGIERSGWRRMIRDPARAAEYLQIRGASVPIDRS